MAKSDKADKSEHKTARQSIQFPKAWVDVARRLAAESRQPVSWLIITMIEEAARKKKIEDLPPLPWSAESEE